MAEEPKGIEYDISELYERRVIVLMETDAQSNQYNQLSMDAEQFRKLSDIIATFWVKTGEKGNMETYDIPIVGLRGTIRLPEELRTISWKKTK